MKTRLLHDDSASSAAEFALLLPLLMTLLFGIIDAGRFAWEYNRAEKATQVGIRIAVVTDSVPTGLQSENYVGTTVGGVTLTQGDVIPAAALGEITCTEASGCTCTTTPCPATIGTIDYTNTGVFKSLLLPSMQSMKSDITSANVELHFYGSGLGYAGDPNGMDIAPIVGVRLTGVQFVPITSYLFTSFTMPAILSTLSAEDLSGTTSN
ncbi:MAG: TadE/TadG family type IV pilus assembly protein [Sphingomicrobium sp.]